MINDPLPARFFEASPAQVSSGAGIFRKILLRGMQIRRGFVCPPRTRLALERFSFEILKPSFRIRSRFPAPFLQRKQITPRLMDTS